MKTRKDKYAIQKGICTTECCDKFSNNEYRKKLATKMLIREYIVLEKSFRSAQANEL